MDRTVLELWVIGFLAIVTITGVVLLYMRNRKAHRRIDTLENTLDRYGRSDCCIEPRYIASRIREDSEAPQEVKGKWAVARVTIVDGFYRYSCVKVFMDEDNEFNEAEARELCEILNAK